MSDSTVYRNALAVGTELMEYRVSAVLGSGGFGLTYLAWDAHLQKKVAIKEYLPGDMALRALDGSVVPVATQRNDDYRWGLERFLQEARTLARFSHPNIVRVIRYFEANHTAYMVMEYEQGESLSQVLKRDPRPSEARLRAIAAPLLDGLRAVHEAGFLHRDIKPGNIFLRADDSPVLIDFGAARHAVGGNGSYTAVVTPGYAPIEQYSLEARQGAWSDIYAVSGVFYRAVTNDNPPDAVTRLRRDTVGEALAAARDRYGDRFLAALGWGLQMEERQRPQSVADWQGAFSGASAIPYRFAEVAPSAAADAVTRIAAASPRRESRSRPWWRSRYAWGVPTVLVLAALTVRALERDGNTMSAPAAAPAPAESLRAQPERAPTVVNTRAEIESPRPAARRKATVSRPLTETAAIEMEPHDEGAPPAGSAHTARAARASQSAAPVRDAVRLPPLAGAERDRPTRERTSRQSFER